MTIDLAIDAADTLVVTLQEGDLQTTVSVRPARAGATSLHRALATALESGYADCFWPAATGGQYWWIFSRRDESLETIVMWTRGGASLWEHVFRVTDAAGWVHERLIAECRRIGIEV